MYSRKVVANRIAQLESDGKSLIYYTPAYIQACISHLESLAIRDDKRRVVELQRPLTKDEQQFISNERLLCGLDYLHWAENYHYVRHAETLALVPFKQNKYQQVLTLAQAELEEQGKPVVVQLLKARQGGGTTDTTSKIMHRMLFVPDSAAVIGSSDPDKSWLLSEMISRSLPKQPWWLIPPDVKEYQSGEIFLRCDSRNSYISIQHGTQGTGISRGDTVKLFHLSEIPNFDKPELIVDASLFGAWHPTSLHFGVMESTAGGRHDYWHTKWEENKELWPQGLSVMRPLFLPYYISDNLYPTDGWLAAIPIPQDWKPKDYVVEHARKAKEYVRSDPFLAQAMGRDWEMPLATQWWYEYSYDFAERKDKLGDFLAEYASDDLSCFQSRSKSVFSIQLIQKYESRLKQPVGVFKLSGTEVPSWLGAEAQEKLEDAPSIHVKWMGGRDEVDWLWTPIKFPGYSSVHSHLNTLWVWEYPREDKEYAVSLDASEGIGRDRSSLQVIRKGDFGEAASQVASFASDQLGGLEMWPFALMLLHYYSTWNSYKNGMAYPMFSPETASDGGACLLEVRKRGWTRFYMRRTADKRDLSGNKIGNLGWKTTGTGSGHGTRPLLTSWLFKLLKGMFVELNSPWTIDEMRDFVVHESDNSRNIRLEHDKSAHDDDLFSLGIGLVTLHELDIYRGETPQWRSMQEEQEKLVKFATFKEGYPGLTRFDPKDFTKLEEERAGVMRPTYI